jgi:hypothetical protein
MEITCTFCLTGTKPDDTGEVLGKREPLEPHGEDSFEEHGDEEEAISESSSDLDGSNCDGSEGPKIGHQGMFKLVKKSDDDIDLNFKDVDAQEEELDFEADKEAVSCEQSKSLKRPSTAYQENGSERHKEVQPSNGDNHQPKHKASESPLKNMDHNSEYFNSQGLVGKPTPLEETKLGISIDLKEKTLKKSTLTTES